MKESEKEFKECLGILKHFISSSQVEALKYIFAGEESIYAVETVIKLAEIVKTMPSTYETEDIETNEKIVYLHYFYAGSDWYIVVKDKVGEEIEEQYQAFGFAILNYDTVNSEWGYISIQELIETNIVELDFHFTPVRFGDLR